MLSTLVVIASKGENSTLIGRMQLPACTARVRLSLLSHICCALKGLEKIVLEYLADVVVVVFMDAEDEQRKQLLTRLLPAELLLSCCCSHLTCGCSTDNIQTAD